MRQEAGFTVERVDLGKLKVKAIFRTEKESQIIGGTVTEGKIELKQGESAEITRIPPDKSSLGKQDFF